MTQSPIVVVGAPRSGTNLLRDLVCRVSEASTWPCDEINYIWRHGNRDVRTDELAAEAATERVSKYIQRQFARQGNRSGAPVLEKTCATCLRIPFVEEVLQRPRYLVIVRDGRDAFLSAMDRWTGDIDFMYLFRKARFVPFSDLPHYAFEFAYNRVRRVLSSERAAPSWGPRFEGMEEIYAARGLDAVVAAQWARCVTAAEAALAGVPGDRVVRVRYETLVEAPKQELGRILDQLHLSASPDSIALATRSVSTKSVGRWSERGAEVERVMDLLQPGLEATGYSDGV